MTSEIDGKLNIQKQLGDIPQKYEELLQNVLNEMELETGNMYQFTVCKFGNPSNYNCVIGQFKKRNFKIEVHSMDPEYKELEGMYNSRNEVVDKIWELRANDMFEEIKDWVDARGRQFKIGKCKNCHSYNENVPKRHPNIIDINCCQNSKCYNKHLSSIWDGMHISDYCTSIYQSGGGSLSVCHDKGKYRFIK